MNKKIPVLKIATLNTNGLAQKAKTIFDRLGVRSNRFKSSYHPDVLLLQETHLDAKHKLKSEWKKYGGSEAFFAKGYETEGRLGGGVAILLGKAKNIFSDFSKPQIIVEGRVLRLDLKIRNQPFTIISVYAPNQKNEKEIFFQKLHDTIKDIPQRNNVIFGGDFNCVEDVLLDRTNTEAQKEASVAELQIFNSTRLLVDPFRTLFPNKQIFTYVGKNSKGENSKSRLDRIYISEHLAPNAKFLARTLGRKEEIGVSVPDHYVWYTTIKLTGAAPEKVPKKAKNPYFRLNNKFLEDPDYCRGIEEMFERIETFDFKDPKHHWIATKNLLADYSRQFGKEYAKQKREEFAQRIQYEKDLKAENRSENPNQNKIEEISSKISFLEGEEAKKFAFLAKVETAQNEMSISSFLRSMKTRKKATTIDTLRTPDGVETTDPKAILDGIHEFYQDLYGEHSEEINEQMMGSLLEHQKQKVKARFKRALGAPLSVAELTKAIEQLAKNHDKAPGIDGLTAEFYLKYKEILIPYLQRASGKIIEEMRLDNQQSTAVVVLIFKKGLEQLLKDYRPISLLPLDYKIIAKVLANRLAIVLPDLISEEQTSGVPGRTITESTNLIRDVVDYVTIEKKPSILLSLDMEKAFDRVNHTFLIRVLKSMDFPVFFIKCIQTLYNDVTSCVRNNGKLTQNVKFQRGVRQGCPLSPLLFLLVGETLTQAIKKQKDFKGINIPGPLSSPRDLRISAFADDLVFFIRVEKGIDGKVKDYKLNTAIKSLDVFYETMDLYCQASGAKLNASKCKGVILGADKAGNTKIAYDITKVRLSRTKNEIQLTGIEEADGVHILGITYHPDHDQCIILNYSEISKKMEKQIEWLRSRDLTHKGRVDVANALVLSKLWATAATIPFFPSLSESSFAGLYDYRKIFENHVDNFIMVTNNKNTGPSNRVPRTTQEKRLKAGGWGRQLVGPKVLSLQMKQISNILDPDNNKISTLFAKYFLAGRIADPLQIISQQPTFLGEYPKLKVIPYMYKVLETLYGEYRCFFSPKKRNPEYYPVYPSSKKIYQKITNFSADIPPVLDEWKNVSWELSYDLYTSRYKQDTIFFFRHCKLLLHSALKEPCIFCKKIFKTDPPKTDKKKVRDIKVRLSQAIDLEVPDFDVAGPSVVKKRGPSVVKKPKKKPEESGDRPHYHTFFGCSEVFPIWENILKCLNKIDTHLGLSIKKPEGFLTGVKGKTPQSKLINTIINITIYHIWDWRCNKKHGRRETKLGRTCNTPIGVEKRIINDTHRTLLVQHHILRNTNGNLDDLLPILSPGGNTGDAPIFNFYPP